MPKVERIGEKVRDPNTSSASLLDEAIGRLLSGVPFDEVVVGLPPEVTRLVKTAFEIRRLPKKERSLSAFQSGKTLFDKAVRKKAPKS